MTLNIFEVGQHTIAEVVTEGVAVHTIGDALDVIAEANYHGASSVLLQTEQLNGDFFDLRTGLAGEILQKCANYRMRLAVVGEVNHIASKSFSAFVIECNRGNSVFFAPDRAAAIDRITRHPPLN